MPSPVPSVTSTGIPIEVRRSAKRRRTVNAAFRDGKAVISIPGHFTKAQEAEWVRRMVTRLEQRAAPVPPSNPQAQAGELAGRAAELSRRYLNGAAQPVSVRWVTNQNSRWGSATPARGTIRLSDKLQGMPAWVVDYVLLHELAHLIEASHSAAFWRLLESYPYTETAKAYLQGAAFASSRGLEGAMQEDQGADEPVVPDLGDDARGDAQGPS
ncbi:M48 family metallopeptidase [Arthrobacter sp. zg-Y820]|uniref:M48 metallopeptidase family protein n=1 Tax=unclassified Arthrobacter TaxID=235627 RepID=UPI001E472041|nr:MULTISPECIES: M48 family metallopeptidase [unclassified Arthrobacter]MCC9195952.1 M48 family metallopeptidase [Arthrobacter sp. zg-Y820]MDK1278811.1 M48 family metallopeptidase [Arthrobacter sp. zg.Y820]WIB08771.1 M48 family metallopeptidase [Arthrobacter sp. zg-Y820]